MNGHPPVAVRSLISGEANAKGDEVVGGERSNACLPTRGISPRTCHTDAPCVQASRGPAGLDIGRAF
jgi:hypothetical protein